MACVDCTNQQLKKKYIQVYHEHFTWPQQSGVEMQSDGGVVVGTLQLSVLKKYYRRVLLSAHLK